MHSPVLYWLFRQQRSGHKRTHSGPVRLLSLGVHRDNFEDLLRPNLSLSGHFLYSVHRAALVNSCGLHHCFAWHARLRLPQTPGRTHAPNHQTTPPAGWDPSGPGRDAVHVHTAVHLFIFSIPTQHLETPHCYSFPPRALAHQITQTAHSQAGIQAVLGVMLFTCIQQSISSVFGVIFVYPLERSVVLRERASGTYRCVIGLFSLPTDGARESVSQNLSVLDCSLFRNDEVRQLLSRAHVRA